MAAPIARREATTTADPGERAAPRWSDLPPELLLLAFAGVSDEEMTSVSLACRSWRSAAEADELWQPRCARRWRDKYGVAPDRLFRAARMRDDVVQSLSVRDMKQILSARHVDPSVFLEKAEYRAALARSESTVRIPRFVPLAGKWRASFVCSLLDSRSSALTRMELVESTWHFMFKENPLAFSSEVRFAADGRLSMEPWPMNNPGSLTWVLQHPTQGETSVRVHHFPAHVATRLPDW